MARVFVSHASEDRRLAGELRRWLTDDGHEVILDQDLHDDVFGAQWQRRLHERLRWADAVVCVITSAYLASTWCAAEVGIAQSRGSRLLPVLAEPGLAHPLLKPNQHTDMTRDAVLARATLLETLRRVDAAGGLGWPDDWPDDTPPFPGLRPFEINQHRMFFGRNREVKELAELLRSPAEQAKEAVLLIEGPSGCGKSSLVRAGLLSKLADEAGWRPLSPIVPGADPVAALVRELAKAAQQSGLDWAEEDVQHRIDEDGLRELADELLSASPGGPWTNLLILMDQFEELLTQADPEQRARFVKLLRPALSGRVQVVATVRKEFADPLLADPDLTVLLKPPNYPLKPLRREALRAVIEGPAQLAGIKIAEDLVDRLVDDTDSGEALPLLAFTLAELADGVSRGGELSMARYEELGGVQGALTSQANRALDEAINLTSRRREEILAGLLQLVTVDELGHPTRRRIDRAQLPAPVTQELDVFVTRRLVTTDADTDTHTVFMGVAHEAFLSAWPPLEQTIEENKEALRARRAVELAAAEWKDNPSKARLWERGQLAAAVANTGARLQAHELVTDRVDLSVTARNFLRDSIRRDRFRRNRAITVLSVLLVLALTAAGFAIVAQRDAEDQRNIAVSRQVAAQALELGATNPALAAQLGLTAFRLAPTTQARSSLLSTAAIPYATILTGHTNDVFSVAYSPDGRTLATASADRTAKLWNISDPRQPTQLATLTGHTADVSSVAFSPDGRTLATASYDTTTQLWNISDPRQPTQLATLTGHTADVSSVAFSPDGRTLATASADTTARLWDIRDPSRPSSLPVLTGHTKPVASVAFSPDGHTLATAGYDRTARLWNISDPPHPTSLNILSGYSSGVYAVAFGPNGHTLATANADRTARLWDLPRPIIADHTSDVTAVAFSPNARILATASYDYTARLWDISNPPDVSYQRQPHLLSTLTVNTANPVAFSAVAFSPDGRTLATASYDDKKTRLWNIGNPSQPNLLVTLEGHTDKVFSVAFSPDGRTLATASYDRTARLWDVSDPKQPRPLATLTGHTDGVFSAVFSPDGRTLATASYDTTARLWDVSDPNQPRPLATLTGHTEAVYSAAFSPDGHTLATASKDKTARLWDIRDPSRPSSLPVLTGHTDKVSSVAFSPDGRTLATASYDTTARLWDVSDPNQPRPLATLTGHTDGVLAAAFSPDGHTLATASKDKTARLWETDIAIVAARICRIIPNITQSEWGQYLPGLAYQPPCP